LRFAEGISIRAALSRDRWIQNPEC
jgi:hypothetical protein